MLAGEFWKAMILRDDFLQISSGPTLGAAFSRVVSADRATANDMRHAGELQIESRWLNSKSNLFRHTRLAQALAHPFMLLPIFDTGERQRDRRQAAECGNLSLRSPLQVSGEGSSRIVQAAQQRIRRCEEGVRRNVSRIGVKRGDE